ncbi:MAG TPA: lipase maturation factor family protein [Candidatus Eisenbacteria bacterium]|nr:lipase maturation factor family protein [Candidatus Eisenbacteria bacterium]
MAKPSKPLLVYDGECEFCRLWIDRWRARTGDRIQYATYQEVAARYPNRPLERFRQAVQLYDTDGQWYEGAEAVYRSLGGPGWWAYRTVPGFAPISRAAYRWIAAHRPFCARVTHALWGPSLVTPQATRTVWAFLRVLGLVYLAAFLSLLPQVVGLYGERGILPLVDLIRGAKGQWGNAAFLAAPSWLWLGAGDRMLVGTCLAGAGCSLLLAIGIVPGLAALGAWASYLSITSVGTTFLWFQWDSLLLETGFLALFLAPWRLWSKPSDDPPRPVMLWLTRWLLFRLLIASAAVKLTSGDPNWRQLTALQYHYWTQPIPPPIAWTFAQFPAWFDKLSTLVMFFIEGVCPFLLFGPRRVRFVALGAICSLQILILLTGNYGFFNFLTLALCVCWLDDGIGGVRREAKTKTPSRFAKWGLRAVATAVLLLGLIPFTGALFPQIRWPAAILGLERVISPWRVANGYGLFAIMTTTRPEITIEGSDDGTTWKAYEFRYKPGDPKRPPPFLGPHMPRLDWQMWFASLDGLRQSPWFLYLCERLLQGSEPVTRLLATNPFAGHPPRFIRARLSSYHFTSRAEKKATGAWWKMEEVGLYCPPLTLTAGRVSLVAPDSLPR